MKTSLKQIIFKVTALALVGLAATITFSWLSRNQQVAELEARIKKEEGRYKCGSTEDSFKCELLEFQKRAEAALVWRAQAKTFADSVQQNREGKGKPLTADEINFIHQGVVDYLSLRMDILTSAWKYRSTGEAEYRLAPNSPLGKSVFKSKEGWQVDPLQAEGALFIRKSKLALAAALILYDNYIIGVQPYQENPFLRRLINTDHPNTAKALDKVTLSFNSRTNARIVARALKFYEEVAAFENSRKPASVSDWSENYLDDLIHSSPSYQELKARTAGDVRFLTRSMEWFVTTLSDRMTEFRNDAMGRLSGSFGNAVGLIETRKGLLYGKKEVTESIRSKLKPLDILLEKTPFRLTDAMIPGHWGHAAIWVGNKADLLALGVWDHPAVRPWQKEIEEGRNIVEALRSGVEVNPLERFLNVDDFLVLRAEEMTEADRKAFVIRSFEQLGKKYDFNFDVETDREIVCSELIYVVYYRGYQWPTERKLGRATISPDNVAQVALDDKRLRPVILYHDGKQIQSGLHGALTALVQDGASSFNEVAALQSSEDRRQPSSN